jgi:hypothetical protein
MRLWQSPWHKTGTKASLRVERAVLCECDSLLLVAAALTPDSRNARLLTSAPALTRHRAFVIAATAHARNVSLSVYMVVNVNLRLLCGTAVCMEGGLWWSSRGIQTLIPVSQPRPARHHTCTDRHRGLLLALQHSRTQCRSRRRRSLCTDSAADTTCAFTTLECSCSSVLL